MKGFAAEPRLAPSVAARVDPSNGAVLARFAQSQILRDVPVARDAAQRALIQDPLSSRATLVLALAAVDSSDIAAADKLMARAAELSRRESTADAWMFDLDMTQGRYADAFRRADVMLRREPGLAAQILPTLVKVSTFPPALPDLAGRLAKQPPWRGAFFQSFIGSADADYAAVLAALRDAGGRPTPSELGSLVERQVRLGDADGARALWQQATGRSLPLIVNGGFEGSASAGSLDWQGERAIGRAVGIAPRPDGKGPALRIDPYAVGKPRAVMSQSLLLAPGSYALRYEGRAEGGNGSLEVSVRCAASNQLLARERNDFTQGWATSALTFVVPATNCAVKQVRIATVSGRRSDVPLWIDSFSLRRQ
ncbi:tetratricopeptide repeat protein [Sphingomonas desiccabilis]|uniref:tetratricopeptide repeat protein n=1 Tax=Sphingomonas desiccabilis TaxID=429134 RepID=UPI001010ADE8|nr:hypothetical protein [Sphingomonas desiccabilis]MBB3910006.1 hypothetical protein [Sphingomonas desiccabilis]